MTLYTEGKSMRLYTIVSGSVEEGAKVSTFLLKGAGIKIPAILVGEEGRGRRLGVLPVELPNELYRDWQQTGAVKVLKAKVGETKNGKPKLLAIINDDTDDDKVICVFRTPIGYRGGNSHTGDRTGEDESGQPTFSPFPGEVLVAGVIAQGDAGRMGSGDQLVAVIPKGVVFRTGYSGRLYGSPCAHYYIWTGRSILSATWEERLATDLF